MTLREIFFFLLMNFLPTSFVITALTISFFNEISIFSLSYKCLLYLYALYRVPSFIGGTGKCIENLFCRKKFLSIHRESLKNIYSQYCSEKCNSVDESFKCRGSSILLDIESNTVTAIFILFLQIIVLIVLAFQIIVFRASPGENRRQ